MNLRQGDRDGLMLTVKDNGQGFDLETAAQGSGLGLISLRERVEKLGGTIPFLILTVIFRSFVLDNFQHSANEKQPRQVYDHAKFLVQTP